MEDPIDRANCRNSDPELFENEWLYDQALALCQTCPVRLWCLQRVDPIRGFFDGVAGGFIWVDGKVKSDHRTNPKDPALMTYLKTRRNSQNRNNQ